MISVSAARALKPGINLNGLEKYIDNWIKHLLKKGHASDQIGQIRVPLGESWKDMTAENLQGIKDLYREGGWVLTLEKNTTGKSERQLVLTPLDLLAHPDDSNPMQAIEHGRGDD